MNQTDVVTRLRTGLDHVKDELEEAQASLKAASEELAQRVRPAIERLERTRAAARAALHRLEEEASGAGSALAADLEQDYHRLESQLRVLRSELRAELADNIDSYRSAAGEQLLAWRAALDELRVQANLAKMEAREDLAALVEDLESRYREATRHLRDSAGETALAALREKLRGAFQDIRNAAETVTDTLRSQRQA